MESLTYENLVARLVEALPEVPIEPDSVEDNFAYFVFSDLMRFVNTRVDGSVEDPLLVRIFHFIEEVAQTKDLLVQDVLQDALYYLATAPTDKAKMYMGPNTRRILKRVEAQIYQRGSKAQTIVIASLAVLLLPAVLYLLRVPVGGALLLILMRLCPCISSECGNCSCDTCVYRVLGAMLLLAIGISLLFIARRKYRSRLRSDV